MFKFICYVFYILKKLLSINHVIACSLKSRLHSTGTTCMINTATMCAPTECAPLQPNLLDLRSVLLKFNTFLSFLRFFLFFAKIYRLDKIKLRNVWDVIRHLWVVLDTTIERNSLMENVYPKIKEYLRENYGLEFQVSPQRSREQWRTIQRLTKAFMKLSFWMLSSLFSTQSDDVSTIACMYLMIIMFSTSTCDK